MINLPTNPYVRRGLLYLGLFLAGAGVGYFSLPTTVITKTETKIVTQVVHDTTTNRQDHIKIITVKVEKPNGETVTTTTQTHDDTVASTSDTHSTTDSDTTSSKEVDRTKDSISISALMLVKPLGSPSAPAYGISINKRLLGPFFIGAMGLTNGMIGGSLGISF